MAKKEKKVEAVQGEALQKPQEENVLTTFSYAPSVERFEINNNQAMVKQSELKDNEKFVVINGKTYIQVSEPTHTYLL